ncbi:hypothetical protein ABKV19_015915 [Rosa sericea]
MIGRLSPKQQSGEVRLTYSTSLEAYTGRLIELELVTLGFSSYCRFPVYDNDFGWGRPAWVFSAPLTFKNVATFMDTKEGDGIEVYISLEEQLMAKFETDAEFLAYVSPSGR